MGNVCCNSRPAKAVPDRTKSRHTAKLTTSSRKSVRLTKLPEELSSGPLNTTSESWVPQEDGRCLEVRLASLGALSEPTRARLHDLMEANAKDFYQNEEVVLGHTTVLQEGRESLAFLSSLWLYVLDAESLKLDRKVRLSNVQLMTLDNEGGLLLIHTGGAEPEGDLLLECKEAVALVEAVEVAAHTSLQHYVPVTTADSSETVRRRRNQLGKAALLSYHTSEFQEVMRVFVSHGEVGENRVYLRRTRVCSQQHPETRCQVLLSSKALYFLTEDFSLLEKIPLTQLSGFTLSATSDRVALHSSQGDRMLMLNNSFIEALDKAVAALGLERLQVSRKSKLELDVMFGRNREPVSALPLN